MRGTLRTVPGHVKVPTCDHRKPPPRRPVERAVKFRRFRAIDVRSILEAGPGVPTVVEEGEALVVDLPDVPVRSLEDYRLEDLA